MTNETIFDKPLEEKIKELKSKLYDITEQQDNLLNLCINLELQKTELTEELKELTLISGNIGGSA